ncbi:MAG: hybrid sensor histidine kinase/response regulator [Desulfovermiculus sp.]
MPQAERILIVDDLPDNITVLASALQEYEKSVALDGKTALQIARSLEQPDLILLDIMMPGMDGYHVCAALKADPRTREIPVIFVTALDEVADEAKGLETGAVDFIIKPVVPAIVQARVRTHLDLANSRKELERQNLLLKENEQLREHVDQMARHDLKGPLNGIMNIPYLVMDSEKLSQESRELLEAVVQAADKMLSMINSSQTLYQIETQRFELNPRQVDMGHLLDKVIASVRARAGQQVSISRPSQNEGQNRGFVLGDELLCYSIMSNLITNAVEASPEQGYIQVTCKRNMDWVQVVVENQGRVPPEIQERFFDKYVSRGKKDGTGLGTYMARLFTEVQGGSIHLQSEQDTTRIQVLLPAAVS